MRSICDALRKAKESVLNIPGKISKCGFFGPYFTILFKSIVFSVLTYFEGTVSEFNTWIQCVIIKQK